MRDVSADAVLLAGSIADVVAAASAGLWTPAVATSAPRTVPRPARVADGLGLTLYRAPGWHEREGRQLASEELGIERPRARSRAARLAAASAAARRRGAETVLAGAGSRPIAPETGLSLDAAREVVNRYGLDLVTPFADDGVRRAAEPSEEAVRPRRWQGRDWSGWVLRAAFAEGLGAGLAWPLRTPEQAEAREDESSSQGDRDVQNSNGGPGDQPGQATVGRSGDRVRRA